jgi:hypothetical protein
MHIIEQEDRLKPLDVSLDLPSKCTVDHDDIQVKFNTEQGGKNIVHQDNASTETAKSTVLNDSCSAEKEKADACSRPVNNSSTKPSASGVTSSVPDFSILRGEVCLDDLTIRELQEAFRATFGRQTNVKDKLWLKRRITMGLTNSCNVQSSGCVVKDYKVIRNDAKPELPSIEGMPKVEVEATSLVRNQVLGPKNERDTPSCSYYQSEDQQRSSKRLIGASAENDESQGTLQDEQGTAKRLRKPTKRYIEELSDIETCDSTGKLSSPGKRSAHDEVLPRQRAAPFEEVDSSSITYPTRKDTFGGFSVHVPYVSRMRRGRPRRNLLSFLVTIYLCIFYFPSFVFCLPFLLMKKDEDMKLLHLVMMIRIILFIFLTVDFGGMILCPCLLLFLKPVKDLKHNSLLIHFGS